MCGLVVLGVWLGGYFELSLLWLILSSPSFSKKAFAVVGAPNLLQTSITAFLSGQMLINWFVSTFSDEHYLRHLVTPQDLKLLAIQFCTHLLAAGVIRQIEDTNAPLELVFRVIFLYFFLLYEA